MHALTKDTRATVRLLGIAITGLLALPGFAQAGRGALTQQPGAAGCLSDDGSEPCTRSDLLSGAISVTVAKDGRNAYVALSTGGVAALARDKVAGGLTQLPSPLGCITQTGNGGLCTTGRGIHAPLSIATSPDGRHVYVASFQKDPVTLSSIAAFARDPDTGALAQLPGQQGCISEDIPGAECAPGVGIRGARSITVSRDGKSVYVASPSDSVAVFARNPQTGALTQLPEPRGCISQSGSGGHCTQGRALDGADAVIVGKDGRFVYVASELSRAVAVFARDRSTGALTQPTGESGCIAEDGSAEGCTDGLGLGGPHALVESPSGRNVYVVSLPTDELAVLARDRNSGALTHVQCLENGGSIACDPVSALSGPYSVAVSPDGRQVYVAAQQDGAVVALASDRKTGTLTQLPALDGCISESGSEGQCTDGRALRTARSVAIAKDGRHVYVAAQASKAVAVLQRKR